MRGQLIETVAVDHQCGALALQLPEKVGLGAPFEQNTAYLPHSSRHFCRAKFAYRNP